jgi:hypothetical protein
VLLPAGLTAAERARLYPGDWIFLDSLGSLEFQGDN